MGQPNLLTQAQHRFVVAIIEGKTQADAYKEARFPRGSKPLKDISKDTAGRRASEQMKAPAVQQALARARDAAIDRAAVTVDTLVERLDRAYEVALTSDPPQTNGAVAATMGIAKLLGLVIDRAQLDVIAHKPAFSSKALELDEDEWKRQFDVKLPPSK